MTVYHLECVYVIMLPLPNVENLIENEKLIMWRTFKRMFSKILRSRLRVTLLLLLSTIFILMYVRHITSPLRLNKRRQFDLQDSVEYCNSPHHVSGSENELVDNFKLKQVQLFIRHGDRAPIDVKAIPHIAPVHISCLFNESYGSDTLYKYRHVIGRSIFTVKGSDKTRLLDERMVCVGGQLTPLGYLQHLYNGQHLRRQYFHFLSNVSLSNDIHVQSTDVARTIQSGAALLTGMFTSELFNVELHDKIDILVYEDSSSAHMLLDETMNTYKCKRLSQAENFKATEEFKIFRKNVKQMKDLLASILLLRTESLPAFNRITDVFYTKLCHRQGIPQGPAADIPRSLVKSFLSFSHLFSHIVHAMAGELQVLSLFAQIAVHSLRALLDEGQSKKVVLYSGHDSMITPLLMALGDEKPNWPPYASRIIFEFFEKDDISLKAPLSIKKKIQNTYFRVIYNGVMMRNLKFCKSSEQVNNFCSLEDLYEYVSDGFYSKNIDVAHDMSEVFKFLFIRLKSQCSK